MKKSARIAIAASGAVLLVAANGAAAWADGSEDDGTDQIVEPLILTPTEAELGDTVTVSGVACFGEKAPDPGDDDVNGSDGDTDMDAGEGEDAKEDPREPGPGEVTVQFGSQVATVPADDEGAWEVDFEATEPGLVDVTAVCDAYKDPVEYQPAMIGVDEDLEFTAGAIMDINRDGCEVTLSTETSQGGDYRIEVWDDGELMDTVKWEQDDAGTYDAVWTITQPAMEGAPGVGFGFYGDDGDGDSFLDLVDPYEYPAEVANDCAGVTDGDAKPAAAGDMPATGADSQTTALIAAGVMVSAGAALVAIRKLRKI